MKIKFKKVKHIFLYVSLLVPNFMYGAHTPTHPPSEPTPTTGSGATLTNPLNVDSIEGLIAAVIDIIVKIGAPLIVLFIIYAGFLFVKAQGNEDKLKEAKRALAWTVVGAAILLGAWLIGWVIEGTIDRLRSNPNPQSLEVHQILTLENTSQDPLS